MYKNFTLAAAFLVLAIPALASTPDGQTPSQETVCDDQSGAAYGLCTAYCEAMDCDSPAPHASATACSRVGDKFLQFTGSPVPCDVSCPCPEALPLFAAYLAGTESIDACVSGGGMTNVGNASGFVSVTADNTCSDNGMAPIISLTAAEANVCRDLLRQASVSAGVACTMPE